VERRTIFEGWLLPAALVLPQLVVTALFFLLPAAEAIYSSVTATDAFGLHTRFVGWSNFAALFADPGYLGSLGRTVVFCALVTALSMALGLVLAVFADREIRGRTLYRTLLIWPYAVAPAVAAALWMFMMHPEIGLFGRLLNRAGLHWDYMLNGDEAMALVAIAGAWTQVSYNFVFFLAGLQSIPRSVIEAARMDGARGLRRFRTIVLPLLMPTTFFLLIVNLVYAAFETFGTIMALTRGGPGQATETMVVKVYRDGVVNLDLSGSSAQSVVLMLLVIGLAALQFRFLGRRTIS
jgi:sn-glycerol 3-phosphate transport system permease protein